jgi:hypothetical protein
MNQECTVKIRSRDGSPIRLDKLAAQIEAAGCEIVAVPLAKRHQRIERPAGGWPPLRSVPRHSTAPDFAPEAI